MKLERTVALVTGGAKRVGREIVRELARAGCDVAIHYRHSAEDAEQLAAEHVDSGRKAVTVCGDLNDSASWPAIIQATVNKLGRLDILVNNASEFLTCEPDTLDDFDGALWVRMLRTNLIAPMALAHHARPHLKANGQGNIINLCDIAADRPWPSHLAYCCSKAALAALTKSLARVMAPAVRVNGVAPGIAVFPDEYPANVREQLTKQVPLQRPGSPQEVARLVRFLVESGDYITGQIIPIDGGRSLG